MCTKMEQPFYHDDSYAAAGYGRAPGGLSLHDYKLLKPSLALNLTDPYRGLKAPGARGPGPEGSGGGSYFSAQGSDTGASLKLASSELERLIVPNSNGRKLERIARLEDKVKTLKAENLGLSNTAGVLREQVAQLKQKVMTHVSNGCQLLLGVKGHAF
ncbi:Transcription factor jun-B [Myotis davidii]|uniref:Transcription factor JunB n=1 Tax=Myotis davidii TaxID=225400 RepID=L5LLI4_MYODS|nr:Transcription factor jun-B [Myotis davidii]